VYIHACTTHYPVNERVRVGCVPKSQLVKIPTTGIDPVMAPQLSQLEGNGLIIKILP
jgi:hypothetical protein